MPRPATALILIALLSVTACTDLGSINESTADQRTFDLPGTALTVDSGGADLRLVTGEPGGVTVDRTLTGKATADGNAAWSMNGSRLTLRVTCSGFVPDCGGRHIVHVPPGTAVTVTNDAPTRLVEPSGAVTATVDGSWLTVERPSGRLTLRAEAAVTVTGATSPDVTASSDTRGVALTFRRAPERVDARAPGGAVAVTLPAGPETYRVTCSPGSPAVPSDPSSPRTVSATGTTASVRKAA
ncbi:hypothetical protein [Cryptosporangium aurantiacum]|uniref:Adhesin domain-containing protein n=1 Tax=Cryptosporangium aurantiacum TaxID=134849 RepID=A0A1M7RK15_9ACTN|nr:hypothetical protein [Cryptosporangium aurantiacum]SHN46486.1 hypothetical protein SAMN05443668_11622 [Cryptosporangium aurantiacum]